MGGVREENRAECDQNTLYAVMKLSKNNKLILKCWRAKKIIAF